MARPATGVFVVNLFKLLALCGVTQMDVCRHLGLEPPVVNLWAKGRRPLPQRHREAFEQFVWDAVGHKSESYMNALDEEPDALKGWDPGDAATEPLIFKPPPSDAPPIVQQWWAFHCEALRLMEAWNAEVSLDRNLQELGEICRQVAEYGFMDDDKRESLLLTGGRPALQPLRQRFERGVQILADFERLDPHPFVRTLRRALQPR